MGIQLNYSVLETQIVIFVEILNRMMKIKFLLTALPFSFSFPTKVYSNDVNQCEVEIITENGPKTRDFRDVTSECCNVIRFMAEDPLNFDTIAPQEFCQIQNDFKYCWYHMNIDWFVSIGFLDPSAKHKIQKYRFTCRNIEDLAQSTTVTIKPENDITETSELGATLTTMITYTSETFAEKDQSLQKVTNFAKDIIENFVKPSSHNISHSINALKDEKLEENRETFVKELENQDPSANKPHLTIIDDGLKAEPDKKSWNKRVDSIKTHRNNFNIHRGKTRLNLGKAIEDQQRRNHEKKLDVSNIKPEILAKSPVKSMEVLSITPKDVFVATTTAANEFPNTDHITYSPSTELLTPAITIDSILNSILTQTMKVTPETNTIMTEEISTVDVSNDFADEPAHQNKDYDGYIFNSDIDSKVDEEIEDIEFLNELKSEDQIQLPFLESEDSLENLSLEEIEAKIKERLPENVSFEDIMGKGKVFKSNGSVPLNTEVITTNPNAAEYNDYTESNEEYSDSYEESYSEDISADMYSNQLSNDTTTIVITETSPSTLTTSLTSPNSMTTTSSSIKHSLTIGMIVTLYVMLL